MKRTTVFLSERQVERLADLSKQTSSPASEHIRHAIDFYLDFRERLERIERKLDEFIEAHSPGK